MLNLKSAYYYFLAIKIAFIKFIKKIYFTTKYYQKSLETKIPSKFHFFPNSFLLSSLTNYKDFSFKISDIDPDIFWNKQPSSVNERSLNNFLWLNLIDRKNDASIIQRIITVWIYKNKAYKKNIWDNSVLSERVISWILNANIILDKTDNVFKKDFLNSIIVQINHLKKNIRFENNYSKKIEVLTAIILSGLIFKEYSENLILFIKDLEKTVKNSFDKNGFPLDRNPNNLIKCSKYLVLIKECIKDSQQLVPDFLDDIVERNINCIFSIQGPDNQVPLFNGATESNLYNYLTYLKSLNYKLKKKSNVIGDIKILKDKKIAVFFEIGKPPEINFSSDYQSGPLSFEFFMDEEKIITNCGFGSQISKKAMLLSRLTSAQSCLCINDKSVVNFERRRIINNAFGNSIKNTFKTFDIHQADDESQIMAVASHDAYLKPYGYIHKREIKIIKNNDCLFGEDSLIKKYDTQNNLGYNIRFHLYPGVSAIPTMSGKNILIHIKKNKSLLFSTNEENLSVEKSIFLARNQIINNFCIVISGNTNNENKSVNWKLQKTN